MDNTATGYLCILETLMGITVTYAPPPPPGFRNLVNKVNGLKYLALKFQIWLLAGLNIGEIPSYDSFCCTEGFIPVQNYAFWFEESTSFICVTYG